MQFAKGHHQRLRPARRHRRLGRVRDVINGVPPGKRWMHAYTYSGHPTCCAVALANIDILERERLVERAAVAGERLLRGLRALESMDGVGNVRGLGLMAAVEVVRGQGHEAAVPAGSRADAEADRCAARSRPLHARRAWTASAWRRRSSPPTPSIDRIVEHRRRNDSGGPGRSGRAQMIRRGRRSTLSVVRRRRRAFGVARGVQPEAQAPADTVLINGTVLTVDRADSVAQAVAITGGKIAAVGTTAQIKAMAGPKTEVIDLRGRAVTPGLIDTHVHFSAAASLFTVDLGDADVKSIEEVKKRVRRRSRSSSRASGCAAVDGTRASMRSGATSPLPISMPWPRTIRCG